MFFIHIGIEANQITDRLLRRIFFLHFTPAAGD